MTLKFSRIVITAGALMVAAGVLSACGDSSTASAPLTEGVTTTTMLSSNGKQSASSSEKNDGSSKEADDAASKATTTLPATGPNKSTKVPGNFPGSDAGQNLSDKDKKYLASLKDQKIAFMGDDDGNIALTMGHYVCQEQSRKTDPMMIKAYVRAAIGPVTKSEDEASGKADKIIATADKELC